MKIEATAEQIRALLRLAAGEDEAGLDGRGNAAARLPRAVLERFFTLRSRGRSPAIVSIEDGACSGCHVRLPTMVEQDAARSLALYSCPQCRRLLYARAALGEPPARAAAARGRKSAQAGDRP